MGVEGAEACISERPHVEMSFLEREKTRETRGSYADVGGEVTEPCM